MLVSAGGGGVVDIADMMDAGQTTELPDLNNANYEIASVTVLASIFID